MRVTASTLEGATREQSLPVHIYPPAGSAALTAKEGISADKYVTVDSADKKMTVSHASLPAHSVETGYTITARVRFAKENQWSQKTLFAKGRLEVSGIYGGNGEYPDNNMKATFPTSGGTATADNPSFFAGNFQSKDMHVALIVTKTRVTLYIDGDVRAENKVSGDDVPIDNEDDLVIGARADGTQISSGAFGSVKFYNFPLSQTAVGCLIHFFSCVLVLVMFFVHCFFTCSIISSFVHFVSFKIHSTSSFRCSKIKMSLTSSLPVYW